MWCRVVLCFVVLFCVVLSCVVLRCVVTLLKKPSRFAHFWPGAQSPAPATQNDTWTSKSGPTPSVFNTFDFQMCFPPQRHALFRHPHFQKWSGPISFYHFWLPNFQMCFAPQRRASFKFSYGRGPQIIGKHSESRLSYIFADLHLLSSHSFSSLIFSILLFSTLTLPTSAFPSLPIVGSLTSKLPSINPKIR